MIQLQVLNYILASKDSSFILSNNLTEEFFPDYKDEYKYLLAHINTYGQVPDMATFASTFPDFDIIEVTETPKYLQDKLYDDRNTRLLAEVFNSIKKSLMTDKVDEAMDVYLNSAKSLLESRPIEPVDILKDTSRYDAYVDRCNDFAKYYIKTGFDELDEIIGGWDREEELATIVARSNQGKSWLLLKCAVAAVEQGLRVGLYSGEMSARKVGYRVDTLLSHISNTSLTKGNEEVQNIYKKFLEDLPNKFDGCFKILTPDMINGPAGVNALRAFVKNENLDILFIDQHSLLEDDRKGKIAHEKAANISKDLKNLQVLEKIPIISVSQQNRTSTEGGVGLEHVAQSDRIAQDSTIVIFMDQKDGVMTLHLIKSRDSANMKDLSYDIDLNTGMFTYRPDEEVMDEMRISEALDELIDNGEEVF